jgi:hypothetical protein
MSWHPTVLLAILALTAHALGAKALNESGQMPIYIMTLVTQIDIPLAVILVIGLVAALVRKVVVSSRISWLLVVVSMMVVLAVQVTWMMQSASSFYSLVDQGHGRVNQ